MPVPHHEHHRERLPRPLRMPDDAAPRPRTPAFQQTLHGPLHRPELLVAPDDLDGLALVVDREQGEGADEVEQIAGVEHPGGEALLIVRAAGAVPGSSTVRGQGSVQR